MKTKLIAALGIVLMSLLVVWSCSSEERFTYYLENASHYTIDSGKLNTHHFKLKPNEVAGPFELAIDNSLTSFFSEPMLLLDVAVCSDAEGTYSRTDGIARGHGMIDDKGVYLIRIVSHGDSTRESFDFEIEKADVRK